MIGLKKIKANQMERMQLGIGCYCQLALKVKPDKISEIINEISKKAMPCRNLFDGENYVYTSKPCPVFRIPDNFPSYNELTTYVANNYTIPEVQRLGCICYNNNYVVLNGNHSSCDGGYFKLLARYLTGQKVPKDLNYAIHESFVDSMSELFKKYDGDYYMDSTPIRSRNCETPYANSFYVPVNLPLDNITNYQDGKSKGMTETLMSSILLGVFSHNHKFSDPKIMCAIDARRELPNPDWRNCNIDANVTIHAKGITQKSTINELKKAFRKDLNRAIKEHDAILCLKNIANGTIKGPIYPTVSLSNIGPIYSGGDILDLCINTSVYKPAVAPGSMTLISQCVDDKVLRSRLYVSPVIMSQTEATKLGLSIKYALKYITDDMTIDESLNQINDKFDF